MNEFKDMLRGDFSPYGEKCERCWRMRLDTEHLKHLGVLCNRCYLVMEQMFLDGKLEDFARDNDLTIEQIAEDFPYLRCAA